MFSKHPLRGRSRKGCFYRKKMKKDSFLLYTEQIEIFNSLTDEQAGQLIKAIYQYNKTGELPELNSILKIAIIPIKQQLDVNEKKEFKKFNQNNPDLMFDERINKVFKLYKEKCPNLCPLVFEERNLERRQQVKDLLILCQYDMGYIERLFNRANEQITFYEDKINFQSLIKNHEKIYQGLGTKKSEQKETAKIMQEKWAKWEREAREREQREEKESRLK